MNGCSDYSTFSLNTKAFEVLPKRQGIEIAPECPGVHDIDHKIRKSPILIILHNLHASRSAHAWKMAVNLIRNRLQWHFNFHRLCVVRCASHSSRPNDMIDRIIRVDHAGEYGADRIYAGQVAVLENTSVGPTIKVW